MYNYRSMLQNKLLLKVLRDMYQYIFKVGGVKGGGARPLA